jgi:hypothetical protein
LPAEQLYRVTAEHVWRALERFEADPSRHRFGPSTDYDLLDDDGVRFPPKAVFGLAASEALGLEVGPEHFSGGLTTPCFRVLEAAGFAIVPKGAAAPLDDVAVSPDDRDWAEGRPRLVRHLKRERATGLAKAKKEAFRREHGRLFCERCKMDPVVAFGGEHGEASIEVHHRETQVQDMGEAHRTRLEELECLCANCHRVVHRLLKLELADPPSS